MHCMFQYRRTVSSTFIDSKVEGEGKEGRADSRRRRSRQKVRDSGIERRTAVCFLGSEKQKV